VNKSDSSRAEGTEQTLVRRSLMLAIGAAAIIWIGSLLPWLTVSTDVGVFSFKGTEGDAAITLALAGGIVLLAGVALAQRRATLVTGSLITVAGILAGLEAVNFVGNAQSSLDSESLEIKSTMEVGVWVALFGCVVSAIAGVCLIIAVQRERRTTR
jgi:hypothetical protein